MADVIAQSNINEEKVTAEVIFGGAMAETITGIGVIVVSIIGLAGFMPTIMMSIAVIGLGLSFLFEGGAVASRLSNLLTEITQGRVDIAELEGGLTVEILAGLGGIALGVLSLAGVVPYVLAPIAVIAFGTALLIGSGVKARLNHLAISRQTEERMVHKITREVVLATTGVEILIGLSVTALGVLGVIGIYPAALSLIGILAAGSFILLAGTAIGTRMIAMFRR
jgi:hypothetical protein